MQPLKQDSLIHTICLMAFFSAINVICSLLTVFVPLLSIILIIFLPLTSAIVEINCKDRWFPIYALATIGLSVVVSLSSIDFTLFYVVPSILTGYIFGLISKRAIPDMFGIFLAAIVQTVVSFIFVPIIEAITERNLIDDIAKIFHISNRFFYDNAIILIFFIVSLIQVILSFIVVDGELKALGIKERKNEKNDFYASDACILVGALTPFLARFYLPVAYLFVGICYFFATFVVIDHIKAKQKLLITLDGISILITIFVYAGVNQFLIEGIDLVLLGIAPVLIACISMVHYFLKKSKE